MPDPDSPLPAFPHLSHARGSLDNFERIGDDILLRGWILHPEHVLDRALVSINGTPVGECALAARDDLTAAFPHLPHAGRSGFLIQAPFTHGEDDVLDITVEGRGAGTSLFVFHWHARSRDAVRALPADHLRVRVSGNAAPTAFTQVGLDAAVTMMRAATQHVRTDGGVRRALDWGCGSGRVTAVMTELFPPVDLVGCDLDAEAVAWCNEHIRAGAFHTTGPYPPLPFADQNFDAVFACSVMTHLAWSVQKRWLAEIRRVLRPGGVFVATVHGRFAAAFLPGELANLDRHGILEQGKDRSLDGIAPRNYYRAVFQTPDFTRQRWDKYLEVAEYREAGIAAYQDLVVARRGA